MDNFLVTSETLAAFKTAFDSITPSVTLSGNLITVKNTSSSSPVRITRTTTQLRGFGYSR